MGDDEGEQVEVVFLPDTVDPLEDDPDGHVEHPENHREFHFEAVGEGHLVAGDFPDGVDPERVHAVVVCLFDNGYEHVAGVRVDDTIAAFEPPQIYPEELVIDSPAEPHPEHNSPPPLVGFDEDEENHGNEHVPDIPEHDPDEQPERDDVQGGRVELLVQGDAVGIHNLLGDFEDFAGEEFGRWDFLVLFDVDEEVEDGLVGFEFLELGEFGFRDVAFEGEEVVDGGALDEGLVEGFLFDGVGVEELEVALGVGLFGGVEFGYVVFDVVLGDFEEVVDLDLRLYELFPECLKGFVLVVFDFLVAFHETVQGAQQLVHLVIENGVLS